MRPQNRGLIVLILLTLGTSLAFSFPKFSWPELSPYARYRLSKLPLIGRFIEPPAPPEKEYLETRALIEKLEAERVDRYAPDLFSRIKKKWERAEKYYRTGHYDWARSYFEKIRKLGEKALKETRQRRRARKEAALKALQKLRQAFAARREKLPPEKRLKIALALWRLETLIELEEFEAFEKEARSVKEIYGL